MMCEDRAGIIKAKAIMFIHVIRVLLHTSRSETPHQNMNAKKNMLHEDETRESMPC